MQELFFHDDDDDLFPSSRNDVSITKIVVRALQNGTKLKLNRIQSKSIETVSIFLTPSMKLLSIQLSF